MYPLNSTEKDLLESFPLIGRYLEDGYVVFGELWQARPVCRLDYVTQQIGLGDEGCHQPSHG